MKTLFTVILLLLSNFAFANEWPEVLSLRNVIACTTQDQAEEILDTYQSDGVESAGRIIKRLLNEQNERGQRKCGLATGMVVFVAEKNSYDISSKEGMMNYVILKVFEPENKNFWYVLLGKKTSSESF